MTKNRVGIILKKTSRKIMRKIALLLLTIPTLVLSSCKSDQTDKSKIALDYGHYRTSSVTSMSQLTELDYDNLDALLATKESFVLLTYGNPYCGCWTDFTERCVLNFVNEYHYDFRYFNVSLLDGHSEKFGIYSGYSAMPGIVFIRRGKVIRQTIYGKLNENNRKMFKLYDKFEEFMLKNIYLPKMYYLEKDLLDTKISAGEDFTLYVARAECWDCKAINSSALYKWSDKNKESTNIMYIFNIDPYYASRPSIDDPDYEEKMAKYQAYLLFKTNYGLSAEGCAEFGFDNGYVPTFQKRTGSTITDMITVLNDYVEENSEVVTSFFNETRIANSPILRDTGNTYLINGREIESQYVYPWGNVVQELQLEWHTPIVNLFLDSYLK